jgi:hypothetical protein
MLLPRRSHFRKAIWLFAASEKPHPLRIRCRPTSCGARAALGMQNSIEQMPRRTLNCDGQDASVLYQASRENAGWSCREQSRTRRSFASTSSLGRKWRGTLWKARAPFHDASWTYLEKHMTCPVCYCYKLGLLLRLHRVKLKQEYYCWLDCSLLSRPL